MGLPFDQVVRQQHFIQDHPEWSIHAQDGARRFIAEKGDGQDCHVVAALSLRELLNRLEEIVAGPVTDLGRPGPGHPAPDHLPAPAPGLARPRPATGDGADGTWHACNGTTDLAADSLAALLDELDWFHAT